jgi:hypothetical protein
LRIQNFAALDGRSKLDHSARQSREVFEHYRNSSESDLRRIAFPEL